MRKAVFAVLVFNLIAAGQAIAAVKDSNAAGFTSVNEVLIDAERKNAWQAAINDVNQWWSSDHTVSGEASRLRIDAKPQGCFCEELGESAGVVHMTVTMISPDVILRLTGGLGPLGLMGLDGNMTWEFEDAEDATRVRFTYAVGGYHPDGLDTLAAPVDSVLSEALLRLKAYIETGDAEQTGLE